MHDTTGTAVNNKIITTDNIEAEIERLINNREEFNSFVYTPLNEAMLLLKNRENINIFDDKDVPLEFKAGKSKALLLRYIATPNFEVIRFLHLTEIHTGLEPIIGEFTADKFVPSNILKRYLCKIRFYNSIDTNGKILTSPIDLVDIEQFQNKKFSEILTRKGESLVNFHHLFFKKSLPSYSNTSFFDFSNFHYLNGKSANFFYSKLMLLFVKKNILFENFSLNDKHERNFVKSIFLPAFIETIKTTGYKPLIVALEPTELEDEDFWACYPSVFSKMY